jgi:mRNA interferase MazF
VNRGDIYDAPFPGGRRPGVIVTRDVAIPLLRNVTLAPVTSNPRGLVTEVPVGHENGLRMESVVSCDNLTTVRKKDLGERRGSLTAEQVFRCDFALKVALGIQ